MCIRIGLQGIHRICVTSHTTYYVKLLTHVLCRIYLSFTHGMYDATMKTKIKRNKNMYRVREYNRQKYVAYLITYTSCLGIYILMM